MLLGQNQSTQFLPSTITNYIWLSIYQDDGNGNYSTAGILNEGTKNITLDNVTYTGVDNANSAMPRSYNANHGSIEGILYNVFSATAESRTLSMVSGDRAVDSICPSGWRLPAGKIYGSSSVNKSMEEMVEDEEYGWGSTGSQKMRSLPYMASIVGLYGSGGGPWGYRTNNITWSSLVRSSTMQYNVGMEPANSYGSNYSRIGDGGTVRCLNK